MGIDKVEFQSNDRTIPVFGTKRAMLIDAKNNDLRDSTNNLKRAKIGRGGHSLMVRKVAAGQTTRPLLELSNVRPESFLALIEIWRDSFSYTQSSFNGNVTAMCRSKDNRLNAAWYTASVNEWLRFYFARRGADKYVLNHSDEVEIGMFLGCSLEQSEAMATNNFSHDRLPVLSLVAGYLDLSVESYSYASLVYDRYAHRLLNPKNLKSGQPGDIFSYVSASNMGIVSSILEPLEHPEEYFLGWLIASSMFRIHRYQVGDAVESGLLPLEYCRLASAGLSHQDILKVSEFDIDDETVVAAFSSFDGSGITFEDGDNELPVSVRFSEYDREEETSDAVRRWRKTL